MIQHLSKNICKILQQRKKSKEIKKNLSVYIKYQILYFIIKNRLTLNKMGIINI